MKDNLPVRALWESVGSPELADLAADTVDFTLDTLVESEALEQLPIVGWLLKARRALGSVRDELFFRKVVRFLSPVSTVDEKTRVEFAVRMHANPDFAQRVGENFLLWLDRLNSMDKVPLLSRVFQAFVSEHISFSEATMLADVIDRGYLPYLRELTPSTDSRFPDAVHDSTVVTHFVGIGLMKFEARWGSVNRQFKRDVPAQDVKLLTYSYTPLAYTFAEIVLADEREENDQIVSR